MTLILPSAPPKGRAKIILPSDPTQPPTPPRRRRARAPQKSTLPTPRQLKRVHGYNNRTLSFEATDELELRRASADKALAIQISDVIQQHYPGHRFVVKVSSRQQIVQIQLAPFMGNLWYKIGLPYLVNDPSMKRVIRAAGEILERFRMPRAGFSLDDFLRARAQVPPWLLGRGDYIPD